MNILGEVFGSIGPEIALFCSVALGFWVGRIRIGPVALGGVCGTLLVALVVGQSGIQIAPVVKSFFFVLFIFALGYAGGPQFFANLSRKGLRLGLLSLIEVALAAGIALGAAKVFAFDAGTAAGLIAGAATESAVIGTATEAIGRLDIPAEQIKTLQANVVTAYSLTYLFGLVAIVIFTSQIAPMLLRVNLKDEADKLWNAMNGGEDDADDADTGNEIHSRIYLVGIGHGKAVGSVEKALGGLVRLQRLRRRGRDVKVTPDLVLRAGDEVLAAGPLKRLGRTESLLGREIAGEEKLNQVVASAEFVLSNAEFVDKAIGQLRAFAHGDEATRRVYLAGVERGGNDLPLLADLRLQPGDVVRLYGNPARVDEVGKRLGRKVEETSRTNFVYAGLGIVAGILIGTLGIRLGGIYFSLGTGGGALLSGLAAGWFQAKHPAVPGIPADAIELMKDLGLATFIACVGISAGPEALGLVKKYGIILPAVGLCIALVPALVSLAVGHLFLKIEAPVLLGGIAGQQCSTPALSAVQSAAGNTTPLLGYTITYAISNVLLPLLGPVIVGLAA